MYRTVLTYIIGSLIVGALIFGARRILNPTDTYTRTITTDVVQGILVGVGLAFITLLIIGNAYVRCQGVPWKTDAEQREST
jgi:hypothetical protein